jgi:hypothetical protein
MRPMVRSARSIHGAWRRPSELTREEKTMSAERFIQLLYRHQNRRKDIEALTSDARLMAVLNREMPDRVPVCLPGFDLHAWAGESYDGLLEEMAAHTDPIYDVLLVYDRLKPIPSESPASTLRRKSFGGSRVGSVRRIPSDNYRRICAELYW